MNFLLKILLDERGTTLAVTYSFSPNTLIASTQMNTNFDDIEAVVNALTSTNYSADSVLAAALGSDVVRAGYGLYQHTDGSLYVDVSDTNPCLEISDGGVRVKVDDLLIQRTSSGLNIKESSIHHGAIAGLTDDDHTQYLLKTGSIASITTKDHDLLGGLTDNDHPQYVRGQSTNYKIDSGTLTPTNSTPVVVNFNFAFTVAPIVVISCGSISTDNIETPYVTNVGTTSFTVNHNYNNSLVINWIAIGTAA